MDLYINGTGFITANGSSNTADFLAAQPQYDTNRLTAQEPDYTGIIAPMQLRRMSKGVRMGIAASKICLADANLAKPDALSVGTALGCLNDSEHFLSKMVQQEEQMLTPTSFIQSTHNTVAGQIALVLGCNGHNLTYVHRGHSFEQALINTALYLHEHPDHAMLAGGIEELTDTSFKAYEQAMVYKTAPVTADTLYVSESKGSIAGEGAAFFTLSRKPAKQRNLRITGLHTFVSRDEAKMLELITEVLQQNDHTDLAILGEDGDARSNKLYEQLHQGALQTTATGCFKHITGEYATAGAAGLGLVDYALQNDRWDIFRTGVQLQPQRIVFINHFLYHYSVYLLEVVNS